MTDEDVAKTLAFDLPRIWATQVQVSKNGELASIIFREIANVVADPPESSPGTLTRNVASIIVPADVASQLGVLLTQTFPSVATEAE